MDFLKPNNYFTLLNTNLEPTLTLYGLEPRSGKALANFVIIPYKNPKDDTIIKHFLYDVISTHTLPFPNGIANNVKKLLKPKTTKQAYVNTVTQLKQHIQQGNVYEINYCMEFYANDVEIDPLQTFIKLQELTKAPYCKLVKLQDDFIISASPELFLKKERNTLYTKPIKGTIKRGVSALQDKALKEQLFTSIKDRTENVMAVDVARNDLSILAQKGSVAVNKLYNIETFETLHQMVSTVSCELKQNQTFDSIIKATFPMASMTGAPKISAMNLIDEFENFDRNYYSGAMGLIDEKGIFYNQHTKRLSIAVGSAITHLSDPEKEYEECLLKANALLIALNAEIAPI
jgi:para-aminobenzoate synthetase component I